MHSNKKIEELLEARVNHLGEKFVKLDEVESTQYFQSLKKNLRESFEIALAKSSEFQRKLKIIFIEYDFVWGENDGEREAYLCGFGDGEEFSYSILKEPEYIEYNFKAELFNGVGNIKFDIETDKVTEIIDEENGIHIRHGLKQIDIDQVYLFLHQVLKELAPEIFTGKENLENEIYVYANLHDNPHTNIFVIRK